MPIQKNNSCRMGGPEKGQWVTKILIRASTGVCENHNHLPSEVKSFQGLIFRHWEISSYHHLHGAPRKRTPIFLTRVTERVSFCNQTP